MIGHILAQRVIIKEYWVSRIFTSLYGVLGCSVPPNWKPHALSFFSWKCDGTRLETTEATFVPSFNESANRESVAFPMKCFPFV